MFRNLSMRDKKVYEPVCLAHILGRCDIKEEMWVEQMGFEDIKIAKITFYPYGDKAPYLYLLEAELNWSSWNKQGMPFTNARWYWLVQIFEITVSIPQWLDPSTNHSKNESPKCQSGCKLNGWIPQNHDNEWAIKYSSASLKIRFSPPMWSHEFGMVINFQERWDFMILSWGQIGRCVLWICYRSILHLWKHVCVCVFTALGEMCHWWWKVWSPWQFPLGLRLTYGASDLTWKRSRLKLCHQLLQKGTLDKKTN